MSRYMDIKFRGIVKKEFREIMEPIALEGKWKESEDPVLKEFAESHYYAGFTMTNYVYAIERWENEPWEHIYDKETGLWQFYYPVNIHHFPFVEWEEDIIPYIMESVEHYETWVEPVADEPYDKGTCLQKLIDGEFVVVGFFEEDGTFVSVEELKKEKNGK